MHIPAENTKQFQKAAAQPGVKTTAQRKQQKAPSSGINFTVQRQENKTGMSDQLKSGIENLSGVSMNDVKVHYNSAKPAQLNAHAYAQGSNIHVAPGQEKHVPHEAWHVVQQKQGRVQPTTQLQGVNINDNKGLETEADVMGAKAVQMKVENNTAPKTAYVQRPVAQRALVTDADLDALPRTAAGHYQWAGLRTDMHHTAASADGQVAAYDGTDGRGAALAGAAGGNLTTRVAWWSPTIDTGMEGHYMEASRLGPDHKLGSEPGDAHAAHRRAHFALLSGQTYVAGHLLNENLGGPGTATNLTAIPQAANAQHATQVEADVKRLVNEQGRWVKYTVAIDYGEVDNVSPAPLPGANPAAKAAAAKLQGGYADGTRGAPLLKIRYASAINATWGPIAADGNPAGAVTGKKISIERPADPEPAPAPPAAAVAAALPAAAAVLPAKGTSGVARDLHNNAAAADGLYNANIRAAAAADPAAATTTIGYNNIVLDNTDDVRTKHVGRASLLVHANTMAAQIADLQNRLALMTADRDRLAALVPPAPLAAAPLLAPAAAMFPLHAMGGGGAGVAVAGHDAAAAVVAAADHDDGAGPAAVDVGHAVVDPAQVAKKRKATGPNPDAGDE